MKNNKNDYPLWKDIPYAGEKRPPLNGETPNAGSWNTYYLQHSNDGEGFEDKDGRRIKLEIQDPNTIDWYQQLKVVQKTLATITENEIIIAKYWGSGPATKQWTPIADILIDSYGVEAPRAARILAALHAGINDAFVVAWHLKYKYQVARPNQLDQKLATIICTPRHPTYPSGHATISGAAEIILSYFFPAEKNHLKKLAEQNAKSRLYAGVHFPIDNSEGLRLGRQIGRLVIEQLMKEKDSTGSLIDTPYRKSRHSKLLPPPYKQAIPYDFDFSCQSLVVGSNDVGHHSSSSLSKPKLYL